MAEYSSSVDNGMAESFVNTFKRGYVSRMDLSDARTVLAQLPSAFEHFNEVHPHLTLKVRSPREFRLQQVEQLRRAQLNQSTLLSVWAVPGRKLRCLRRTVNPCDPPA